MSAPLISIRSLTKSYGNLLAVDNLSLDIFEGETLALIGESGSGKTTVGMLLLRLTPSTSGKIIMDGRDILSLKRSEFMPLRRDLQIIFQDPGSSLNPRMTIEDIVGEPLDINNLTTKKTRHADIAKLLNLVSLSESFMQRFPHELSGGQKQRVGIARALASKPKFIVCDEALSALDVSVQAQIVTLLQDLQKKFGLTYLFTSHDLRMVRYFATRIAVMHQGKLVEIAPCEELFTNPQHPYTKSLLASLP